MMRVLLSMTLSAGFLVSGCASLQEKTGSKVDAIEPEISSVLPQIIAVSAPPETSKPVATWEIATPDKTLKSAITRWSAAAGWQLSWELPIDYAIELRTTITGTFEEAVEVVAKSMDKAEVPMKMILYKGNKVLRIVAKGVE